ncbi:MAG TPA: inositol monophosphatase [Opitutaceae bacterium]|nr:inositol monophosphatase [Opitutaceae bacterium]
MGAVAWCHGVNPERQTRIEAARRAVLAQAGALRRGFRRAPSAWKSDGTRVTDADLAISEAILRDLQAQFPADQVFSEEMLAAREPTAVTARYCWVLDPIDGTNNYAAGIPFCAISLALLEDGQPVHGVIYDMARRTLIRGGPDLGAFDGRKRARVRLETPRATSLIGFHSPYDKAIAPKVEAVIQEFKIRGLGSSTLHLAYVGIGLLDGVVDHNVRVWDIAAAHAVALGGGAEIHYLRNNPFPLRQFDLAMPRIHYVAGNGAICARLRELLAARQSPR